MTALMKDSKRLSNTNHFKLPKFSPSNSSPPSGLCLYRSSLEPFIVCSSFMTTPPGLQRIIIILIIPRKIDGTERPNMQRENKN